MVRSGVNCCANKIDFIVEIFESCGRVEVLVACMSMNYTSWCMVFVVEICGLNGGFVGCFACIGIGIGLC